MKLDKKSLVKSIKEEIPDYNLYEIEDVIEGFTRAVLKELAKGNEVSIYNFGTFKLRKAGVRSHNVMTGGASVLNATPMFSFSHTTKMNFVYNKESLLGVEKKEDTEEKVE